jgi:DNA-binding MarR family transcriptional regulator
VPLAFRVMNEIGIIEQLARTAFERVMPDHLTVAQFTVLNHFVRLDGERSPLQLARAFQVTKGTMTSTLARLSAKGFVAITADPTDGRAKRVALSPAGRAAHMRAVAALGPQLAELEVAVGRPLLEILLPRLTQLRKYLDARRAEPAAGPASDA